MKAELVKREDHWGLYNEDGHKIAATIDGCNSKLSIKNCNEIFRVLDVETLSDEYSHDSIWFNKRGAYNDQEFFEYIAKKSFTDGFNKAMELNKDKLFTVEDLYRAFLINSAGNNITLRHFFEETVLPMFEQPTEIEVEIEQELIQSSIQGEAIWKTRLDKDGCLILKRI
jgi:hypothetical protein